MRLFLILLVLVCFDVNAQWKSYQLGVKGDTLNRVDQQNLKQGAWILHIESLRGEPGYEEEGVFRDGKKEGLWRGVSIFSFGEVFDFNSKYINRFFQSLTNSFWGTG